MYFFLLYRPNKDNKCKKYFKNIIIENFIDSGRIRPYKVAAYVNDIGRIRPYSHMTFTYKNKGILVTNSSKNNKNNLGKYFQSMK